MQPLPFDKKNILIVGGGSETGLSTAQIFARNGANIAIVDQEQSRLNRAVREVSLYGGKVVGIPDKPAETERELMIAREARAAFGRIDIFVDCRENVDLPVMGRIESLST